MGKGDVKILIMGDASDAKKAFADAERAANKFNGGIKSGFAESGRHADGFKSKLGGISAGLGGLAAGLVGGQLFSFLNSSVTAASDLNETVSKTKVVFGAAADQVLKLGDNSAVALRMSKNEALSAAAAYGNLLRATGMAEGKSADMSTKLVQLAADLASFNNVPVDQALEALRSGLVGETEPLRNFGVSLSAARVDAEALRMGLVKGIAVSADVETATVAISKANLAAAKAAKEHGYASLQYRDAAAKVTQAEDALATKMAGKVPDLDAATKAQAAYSIVMQDTALAQGDAANTADGYAGRLATQKAEFENLKIQIGEKLLPVWLGAMDLMNKSADSVKKWWDENGPGLKATFHDVFGADPAKNFAAGLDEIKAAGQGVADWWTSNIGTMEDFKRGLADLERGFGVLGEKAAWVKDNVLDPIVGTIQNITNAAADFNDKLKTFQGGDKPQADGSVKPTFQATDLTSPFSLARKMADIWGAGFATGGILPDGISHVGELGPELAVTQGGQTRIIPNQQAGSSGGGAQMLQATIPITVVVDGQTITTSVQRRELAIR